MIQTSDHVHLVQYRALIPFDKLLGDDSDKGISANTNLRAKQCILERNVTLRVTGRRCFAPSRPYDLAERTTAKLLLHGW